MSPRASAAPAAEQARLVAYLDERGSSGSRIEPMSGDASTRRYFRLRREGESLVVAVYPDAFEPADSTFLIMRELLSQWGIPVPAIRDVDGPRGIVVLEDLGDRSLQRALGENPAGRDAWYDQALDQLVRLQAVSADGPHRGPCFDAAFDVEKLSFELRFFEEHFLAGLRGCRLSDTERSQFVEAVQALCGELAGWPRVVCHRDFHSRNLMLRDATLVWVDFQDARLGPTTYDLASLLRDSYVELPDDFVAARVEAFREHIAPAEPAATFRRRFELTCVQRNLKALGTFGYMEASRGSLIYRESIPRTLRNVRRHLERHSELQPLRRVLARHLEELQ